MPWRNNHLLILLRNRSDTKSPFAFVRRDISDSRGRALLAALSSMFSWLKRQRRIESNPCAGVQEVRNFRATGTLIGQAALAKQGPENLLVRKL